MELVDALYKAGLDQLVVEADGVLDLEHLHLLQEVAAQMLGDLIKVLHTVFVGVAEFREKRDGNANFR